MYELLFFCCLMKFCSLCEELMMNSFVTRLVALDRMIEITTLLLPSCLLLRHCRHHPMSAPPQPNRPHHQKSRSWEKEIGRCHEEYTISKPFSRDKYIRHTLSVDKSNSEKKYILFKRREHVSANNQATSKFLQ